MSNEKQDVFISVPSSLMRFLLSDDKPEIVCSLTVDNILAYAVYERQKRTGKTLQSVYNDLGLEVQTNGTKETDQSVVISHMKRTWRLGKLVSEGGTDYEDGNDFTMHSEYLPITCHTHFTIPISELIRLRNAYVKKFPHYDTAVCDLMFWALGSIKGRKDYAMTNDLFLLARMNGDDKPNKVSKPRFKNSMAKQKYEEKMSALSQREKLLCEYNFTSEIRAIGTRRKMLKYRKMLSETYKVAFYPKTRGYYFSMKLTLEELKSKVESQKLSKKGGYENV